MRVGQIQRAGRVSFPLPMTTSLLICTKRIVGRCDASQIASASAASLFCRLTKGFT